MRLTRNLRSYIATRAEIARARPSMEEELMPPPWAPPVRLPTPLSLATTDEGLALTARQRPPEVAVAEVEQEAPVVPVAEVMAEVAALAVEVHTEVAVSQVVAPKPPDVIDRPKARPAPREQKKPRSQPKEPIVDPRTPVAPHGQRQVEFRDVSIAYGSISALRGVSFAIGAGELVFLIGASGAGKTTTFRLISGQVRPTKGEVWVGGTPVHKARRHQIASVRRRVGFVGEDYGLLASRTALENVEFALRVADLSLPMAEVKRRSLAELKNVGLASRTGALPGQLSTGQRQRLALARGLVTRPLILLCDEPTAGLDSRNAIRVLRLLQRAAARQTAVLVATHDGPLAASVTARVLSLDKGKLQGDFPSWVELCRAE
jgi:cell division transport system ATP-binding protein